MIPSVLFALSLVIRMIVAWSWQFDGLYGQDAFDYYGQAAKITAHLTDGRWSIPEFFWPNGFPFLAALAMMIFGISPIASQALNMVLGSAVVVLIFLVGRDLLTGSPEREEKVPDRYAEAVGLVAAATTMVAGQLVLSSVVVMADMAAAFWLTLSAWVLIRFVMSPNSWGLVTAAAAAGAAGVVTRWATVLAGPAFAIVAVSTLRKCNRRQLAVLSALAAALLVALPQLVLSLAGKDGGLAGYFEGWSPLNFFLRTFVTEEGLTRYRLPNGVFYLAPWWHPDLMPPTIGIFAVPGLLALWRQRHIGALLLLSLWMMVPYLFFVGIPHQNLRYSLTIWVPAVVLVAVGVVELWRKPTRRPLVAVLLLLSLVGSLLWNCTRWGRFFDTHNRTTAMARHLDEVLPPDAIVLSFEATLALDYYTAAEVLELYVMDSDDLKACMNRGNPVWAIVNPDRIETQWRNLAPWNNLMWLRSNHQLTVVEEHAPWVVYSIRPSGAEPQLP